MKYIGRMKCMIYSVYAVYEVYGEYMVYMRTCGPSGSKPEKCHRPHRHTAQQHLTRGQYCRITPLEEGVAQAWPHNMHGPTLFSSLLPAGSGTGMWPHFVLRVSYTNI